ncbi:XdhC family protein [Paenibacillus harenae]|uniref:XdhC family protein n=1 Tax=Paenibacillus harenae TaxID=306543 RepID=UPI0003F5C57F|nr:XdhC family protein [Paenibacillus harenae]
MGDLYDVLDALSDTNGQKLLATIIRVEGSAYRKEGTMMLLTEDHKRVGLLSGGCLDDDLAERAPLVWEEGVSRTVVYDLSAEDDLSWGQGHGCNGILHVLMEPLDGEQTEHLHNLRRQLNDGISLLHIKRLSEEWTVTDYLFYSENNQWFGKWSGAIPQHLDRLFANRKAGLKGLKESCQPTERFFIQFFEPKPRLIIFGAGPDAKPLVSFAARAGFHVVVTDWRPALCNHIHFPEANERVIGLPDTIAADFPFSRRDSVIVMTHHFQKDQQIIHALISKKLQYFGILGSRERTARLLGGAIPSWLHSPVGLPIGAEGPEEIAISILGDVIKADRLRRGEDKNDLGNISGGRPEQENGQIQIVSACRS